MNVSETLLGEAIYVVEEGNEEITSVMAGCGCSGCGLGCSGTVGMD